jgi:hypothetical protein
LEGAGTGRAIILAFLLFKDEIGCRKGSSEGGLEPIHVAGILEEARNVFAASEKEGDLRCVPSAGCLEWLLCFVVA